LGKLVVEVQVKAEGMPPNALAAFQAPKPPGPTA